MISVLTKKLATNLAILEFKLPARRHLGFYDVLWLPLLLHNKRYIFFLTIVATTIRPNTKWRRSGNLKPRNGGCLYPIFRKHFSNYISANSGGFL